MSDFKDTPVTEMDLADFDEAFEGAEGDNEREFEPIPDGRYQVIVDRVELVRTSKGDPMLKWTLRVLGPTHEGRLLWRNNVMASAENVKWLKRDLYACDLRIARLSELPANLERLLDIRLEVTKRSKGEYESICINKRIRTAEEAQAKAGAPAPKPTGTKPAGKARDALSKF